MAACSYCGTSILFGGKQVGSHRFCNQQCAAKGSWLKLADQFPPAVVEQQVWKLHQGSTHPSPQLEKTVRTMMATQAVARSQANASKT